MPNFLAISGSLRAASANTGMLRTLAAFGPKYGYDLQIANIKDIPHYDQDIEDVGNPESGKLLQNLPWLSLLFLLRFFCSLSVDRIRDAILKANGIIMSCPGPNLFS